PRSEAKSDAPIVDYGERLVTPGLIDSHTHSAWVGSRHTEYVMRMAGADYLSISEAGGGILATYRSVGRAAEELISAELSARLRRMASLGVTTVEVKSGYGLEPDNERKQLRAISAAARDASLPHVVATYLALHAIPEAAKANRGQYIERQTA